MLRKEFTTRKGPLMQRRTHPLQGSLARNHSYSINFSKKAVLAYKLDPADLPNYTIRSTIFFVPVVTTFYNSAICGLSTVKRSGPNFIKAGANGTEVRLSLATEQLLLRVYANVSAFFMGCSMKILVQVSTVSLLVQLTEKRIGQLMVETFEVKLQEVKMEFTEIGHSSLYSNAKSFLEEKIKTFLTEELQSTLRSYIETQVERLNEFVRTKNLTKD
uniref:Putative secreted protein n=1 Tax=Ixodes ricinus TaxID=34613 RepID=A0A0K8RGS7_IXORI